MANTELISETPITMVEIREKLEEIRKRDSELNFRANKSKEHLDNFVILSIAEVEKLNRKLASQLKVKLGVHP